MLKKQIVDEDPSDSDDEPHIVCNSCGIKAYYERNEVAYDANYCRGCDTIEPHTRNGCTKPCLDEIVRGNGRTLAEMSPVFFITLVLTFNPRFCR